MSRIKDPRAIVLHPAKILREKCTPFDRISEESKELAAELRATLSTTTGIGLAAPQIGIAKRMILLRCDPRTKAGGGLILIDPVILDSSDTLSPMMEGCLSIPGERLPVLRPDKVMVEYMSETGHIRTLEFDGLAAKCVQHEIDHLNGILIIDRARPRIECQAPQMGASASATISHFVRSR